MTFFFDKVDAKMLRLEETRIPNQTLATFPLVGARPTLPQGFVAGQRIVQFLSRYMWGFHQVEDFSTLPRPFICNAVDLVTGQDVALSTGFLPEVTRSCISLPGFFEPFQRDSLLLVDGGTSHNLPVDEAKSIGGQVLVGVDVSGDVSSDGTIQLGPDDGGREGSFLFNLTKNLTIKRREAALELRGELDLVVDPLVGGVSAYNFNNAALYIERGRNAARNMVPEIRAFMDSLGTPVARKRIEAPSLQPVLVGSISIEGASGPAEKMVRSMLSFSLPQMIGPEEMDEAITRVYATQLFRTVVYRMIPDPDGGPASIHVRVLPEEIPNTIGIGFRYDDYFASSLLFTIAVRNKIRYGSTTAMVFRFGKLNRLGVEYFSRLGLTASITASASLDFRSGPLRYGSVLSGRIPEKDDDRPILRENLYSARLSLGYALNNASIAGLRVLGGRYAAEVTSYPITDSELLFVDGRLRVPEYRGAKITGRYGALMGFVEARRFNRKSFPTSGYRLRATAEVGAGLRNDTQIIERLEDLLGPLNVTNRNNDYRSFRHYVTQADIIMPIVPKASLLGSFSWTRGVGDGLPLSYYSSVGGIHTTTVFEGSFFSLPGLEDQERLGTNAWVSSVGVQLQIKAKTFLTVQGHAGDAYFDLDLSETQAANDPELARLDGFDLDRAALGLSSTLGLESPIGPIQFTVGSAKGEPVRLGASVGYAF